MRSLKQEVALIAQRYAELFDIAKCSLECYEIFIKTDERTTALYRKYNKLESKQHLIICAVFSHYAIEAFVSHLGFILIDDWKKIEASNFFVLYEKVKEVLKEYGVNDYDFLKKFYPAFTVDRNKLRNPAGHPRPSEHCSLNSENIIAGNPGEHFDVKATEFLNSWLDISPKEAQNIISSIQLIILYIRDELEKFDLVFDDFQRSDLFQQFMDDPFCSIPVITGSTHIVA